MKYQTRIAAAGFIAVLLLGACASSSDFYLQAMGGQFELWRLARPIDAVYHELDDGADLREKLSRAISIRDFASRELGLPDNGSYRHYVDLKRPYVVWNVFAADPFSITPRQWCFPIAGCVNYRGYFNKDSAEAFAADMRAQGYEAYVGGVPAYSTLGWFDDAILNTFIDYPPAELARLIFHELAHQVAYAKDDSEFNESFAVAVEQAGVDRWLTRHGDARMRAAFERARAYRRDFLELIQQYRARLARLYDQDVALDTKRLEKERLLAQMHDDYDRIKAERWDGFSGYDKWVSQANNAALASIGIYNGLVPSLEALLSRKGGDLPSFYAEVKRLAGLPRETRRSSLAALLPAPVAVDAGDGTASRP